MDLGGIPGPVMKKIIVELRPARHKGLVEMVFTDGTCLAVSREVIETAAIGAPGEIDLNHLNKVIKEEDYKRGFDAVLNYLEYRPRSEAEVRQYLRMKKWCCDESIQQIVDKLKDMQLIDDRVFAEMWMRERASLRPKSRLMIKRELLQKGIEFDIASDVTGEVDDEESAYKAGMKKAKLLKNAEQAEFFKRLTAYLARRGFGGDVVRETVTKLWQYFGGS